jgi:hypothetical protein
MTYENLVNDILGINPEDKKEDFWKERAEIPLFSRRPYRNYKDGIIPLGDIITLRIDTRGAQQRNPFNALLCASTGVGKTRFLKNIIKGFWKQGYKILYFEPKSVEMLNARKMGRGKKIAPGDFNESLPTVSYCPNYIRPYIEINYPAMLDKVHFYSPEIAKLNYAEIWQSFGVPVKPASMFVEMIHQGHKSLDYFENHLPKMHSATFQAVSTAVASLKASKFFGTTKKLELEEEWDKGNIVVINYFSRDGAMMNTDVGLVLDQVRDIGLKESRLGLDKVTKKLIVFDDMLYYAGMSSLMATRGTGNINLAIRNIANCQNNFRTWGIDTISVTQSPNPNTVIASLIDGCTTKFVSYVENSRALSDKLPYDAYQLISNTRPDGSTLYVEEENYLFQWIYVQGKTKWVTGFPFDCTVGHS